MKSTKRNPSQKTTRKRKKREGVFQLWKTRADGKRVLASPYWYMSLVVDGNRQRKSTYKKQKSEALEVYRRVKTETQKGEPSFSEHVKIDQIYQEYLQYCDSKGESNIQGKTGHFRKWILPNLGTSKLQELRPLRVEQFRAKLLKAGLSHSTCNRIMSTLRNMIKWATKSELCSPSVYQGMRSIERLGEEPSTIRDPEVDDIENLLSILNEDHPTLHDVIFFIIHTGARIGEVIANPNSGETYPVTWDRVSLNDKMLNLVGKGKKERRVPINRDLLALLRRLPQSIDSPYVFFDPRTGQALNYRTLRVHWEAARKKAGLPKLRIHDLRHFAASQMVRRGASLYDVQKILGHSSSAVTQRYAHLAPDYLRDAVEKLEGVKSVSPTLVKHPKIPKTGSE
jgi:integrase